MKTFLMICAIQFGLNAIDNLFSLFKDEKLSDRIAAFVLLFIRITMVCFSIKYMA